MANQEKPKLLLTVRHGAVSVSVFSKKIQKQDGTSFTAYHCQLQESYKDASEKRQYGTSVSMRNMPLASILLSEAFRKTMEADRAEYTAKNEGEPVEE